MTRCLLVKEPFLDTTGPFAGFLIPLFAWLARQESIRKGRAVRLGMEKAKAKGKSVRRPVVVDRLDAELVAQLRGEGKSWREIAEAHAAVKFGNWQQDQAQGGVCQEGLRRRINGITVGLKSSFCPVKPCIKLSHDSGYPHGQSYQSEDDYCPDCDRSAPAEPGKPALRCPPTPTTHESDVW